MNEITSPIDPINCHQSSVFVQLHQISIDFKWVYLDSFLVRLAQVVDSVQRIFREFEQVLCHVSQVYYSIIQRTIGWDQIP